MPNMTILEAAEHFGVSKEAIHNRVRRGSLNVRVVDGIKLVDVDGSAKATVQAKSKIQTSKASHGSDDKYYKLLEEQNSKLQEKVEKLEGETRTLRDQKEQMLIDERIKIEQIYKDKDEQLKNILSTISSQFMLNAPINNEEEAHLDAEIELVEPVEKGELIPLKKYLREHDFSSKNRYIRKKR